ncbi:hypothetical protein V4U86_20015 [Mycobacterium sp. AMU20-3851]|uniref:Rv1733c family protein n=1 Tax=Mycobacterium sp. AMU20-3851 TaxID=3122055 RepID=UPI00375409F1
MTTSNPGRRHRRPWVLCGLSSSSLVRRQDRIEAVARVLLLAMIFVAVPAAVLAGRAAGAAEAERNLQYTQSLNPVEATIVEIRNAVPSRVPTLVRRVGVEWTEAFQERKAFVSMKETPHVGDRLTIWIDEAGRPADPARQSKQVHSTGLGVGLAVWTGTTVVAVAAFALLRTRLDRRRYVEWDRQWLLLSSGNGRANRDH